MELGSGEEGGVKRVEGVGGGGGRRRREESGGRQVGGITPQAEAEIIKSVTPPANRDIMTVEVLPARVPRTPASRSISYFDDLLKRIPRREDQSPLLHCPAWCFA